MEEERAFILFAKLSQFKSQPLAVFINDDDININENSQHAKTMINNPNRNIWPFRKESSWAMRRLFVIFFTFGNYSNWQSTTWEKFTMQQFLGDNDG